MDERTDEQVLASVAAGPGHLPEFYRRHVARMVAFGARRFSDPEDVADLVAAVFLEVMESAGGFDPRRGSAVAWLYGLAGNLAARERRLRARRSHAAVRLAGRELLSSDDYARIDEQIDAASELRAAYVAMERLAREDRRMLELVAIDGLSPADAAVSLGISRVAARVRLSRARRRLRELLLDAAREAHTDRSSKEVTA